jgi:hypothetical protein
VGDLDNDGDGDLVVFNSAGPARVLLNEQNPERSWLGLATGAIGTWDALGSRAVAESSTGVPVWRRLSTEGSFASSADPRVLFGLGAASPTTTVEVHWANGATSRLLGVPTGRYLTVVQPEIEP